MLDRCGAVESDGLRHRVESDARVHRRLRGTSRLVGLSFASRGPGPQVGPNKIILLNFYDF